MTTREEIEKQLSSEFSQEEIKSSWNVRNVITANNDIELKSIYMAGEIIGSEEMRSQCLDAFEKILKEKMEEEAIAFNEWLRDNTIADGTPKIFFRKWKEYGKESSRFTITELYQIYTEFKNNSKK